MSDPRERFVCDDPESEISFAPAKRVRESRRLRETKDDSGHEHDDKGRFTGGGGSAKKREPRRNRRLERKQAEHQKEHDAWEDEHDAWQEREEARGEQKAKLSELTGYEPTKEESQRLTDSWNEAVDATDFSTPEARQEAEELLKQTLVAHEMVFTGTYEERMLPLLQQAGADEKQVAGVQKKVEIAQNKIRTAGKAWGRARRAEMQLVAERTEKFGPEPPSGDEHDAWEDRIEAAEEATDEAQTAFDETYTEQTSNVQEACDKVLDKLEADVKAEAADDEEPDEPDEPDWQAEREPEVEQALSGIDEHLSDAEADAEGDDDYSDERDEMMKQLDRTRQAIDEGDMEEEAERLHQFHEAARQAATWFSTHGYKEGAQALRHAAVKAKRAADHLDSDEGEE